MQVYLVFELMKGGELLDKILRWNNLIKYWLVCWPLFPWCADKSSSLSGRRERWWRKWRTWWNTCIKTELYTGTVQNMQNMNKMQNMHKMQYIQNRSKQSTPKSIVPLAMFLLLPFLDGCSEYNCCREPNSPRDPFKSKCNFRCCSLQKVHLALLLQCTEDLFSFRETEIITNKKFEMNFSFTHWYVEFKNLNDRHAVHESTNSRDLKPSNILYADDSGNPDTIR